VERPETKYVAVGDADVAYQVFGRGSPDVLFCYGLGRHIDYFWDLEQLADSWRRIASKNRSILFDRRGTGASDSVPRHVLATWEEWAEDLAAVLDVVGSHQAVLIASMEAGAIALLFAPSIPSGSTVSFSSTPRLGSWPTSTIRSGLPPTPSTALKGVPGAWRLFAVKAETAR